MLGSERGASEQGSVLNQPWSGLFHLPNSKMRLIALGWLLCRPKSSASSFGWTVERSN
jgi:hypothetical protein